MRNIFIVFFIFTSISVFCQDRFLPLDTISSKEFHIKLFEEYKSKYDSFNKNLDLIHSDQKKIIEEIYIENQKEFLENVKDYNFITDKNINSYLQELIIEILSKNNIDFKKYKILLSKDAEINASNIGDGTIIINYGLFLAVENEDELVFVISHEIGHQYLNHVKNEIENFAKQSISKEIIQKTNEIRKQKYNKATLANNLLKNIKYKNYSERRKKEIEADSLGLNLYKKTSRNPLSAISLLNKLDKSNKEQDSLTIQDYKLSFEKNRFKLKTSYFESEQSLFQKYDSSITFSIDSLKTHPDCKTRIELLEKHIVTNGQQTNSSFFLEIKKNCVQQNLINLYSNQNYGTCLYESLKLYKLDKNNQELQAVIFLTLEKIYKSKSNYTISKYMPSLDNKNNSQSLNRFINFINNIKMSDLEILLNQFKN